MFADNRAKFDAEQEESQRHEDERFEAIKRQLLLLPDDFDREKLFPEMFIKEAQSVEDLDSGTLDMSGADQLVPGSEEEWAEIQKLMGSPIFFDPDGDTEEEEDLESRLSDNSVSVGLDPSEVDAEPANVNLPDIQNLKLLPPESFEPDTTEAEWREW